MNVMKEAVVLARTFTGDWIARMALALKTVWRKIKAKGAKTMETVKTVIETSKRWKSWAKKMDKVDTSKTNGYAFIGEFVQVNQLIEVHEGDYFLVYEECGSAKNKQPYARLCHIQDGEQVTVVEEVSGQDWALKIRDEVAELVNAKEEISPLAGISTEELIAELKRRGIQI
ncbi:hypothetical protein MF625_001051 [Paenibacillus polymyxa]|uniref:hypothetical protein n=1 Tax=Paenibacillus polymyxa TaxID=1406 RepID=UPI002024F8EF|nr:hypothetical protein [Paenibacillus polymyxa]URJ36632.1 hypothetical protein MF625_001051 [Paenibacillus polymyxa]